MNRGLGSEHIASGIRAMGRRWELQLPKGQPIKDQQKFPTPPMPTGHLGGTSDKEKNSKNLQLQGKPGRILTL